MPSRNSILAVYGEFIRRPYFVIVHSQPRAGHERFDQYKPDDLTELMLSVLEHITGGREDVLEDMCKLDATDKNKSSHRTRRYIARKQDELYATESSHLTPLSIEYRGFWLGTNAKKTQTRDVIELACRVTGVPYETVRKLPGFKSGA